MNSLSSLEEELSDFYCISGASDRFASDFIYLTGAYDEIEKLWRKQFNQMQRIKYIMLSEAPLFGEKKTTSTTRRPHPPNFATARISKP